MPSILKSLVGHSLLLCTLVSSLHAIVLQNSVGNDVSTQITGISYLINGSTINQTSQASQSINESNSVNVTNITLKDNGSQELKFYNLGNAIIRNNNFTQATSSSKSTSGIGVYNTNSTNNVIRIQDDGIETYEAAVIDSATNTNLMNYLFYDGNIDNMPDANTHDFDLLYHYGWTNEDYLIVAERNGNTYFEITPLDADGNVIAGANTLYFDADYGWRTGYHNANDSNGGQDMWFTATSVANFFEGTTITDSEDQVVYGYRIDNNGNADVKFFGASTDSFENNPTSNLVPVPEPKAYALILGLAIAGFSTSRRRARNK
jgi:hypothetical protein